MEVLISSLYFNYNMIFQGRMALLVTLFLVLVNIFNAITTNSPKADGLNALQASLLFILKKIYTNHSCIIISIFNLYSFIAGE